jgi:serine protease Do
VNRQRTFAGLVLLVPALLAGPAAHAFGAPTPTPPPTTDRAPVSASPAIEFADMLSAAFRDAAAAISPSVVNITMVDHPDAAAAPRGAAPSDGIPEEFRRFFQFGPGGASPFGPLTPAPPAERRGQGSGVIIRSDGFILTNNHVVAGADELMARLEDGRELPATIVGTDPESDLAVIRVDARGLPAAVIGDSDRMQPGDWIVAVGNPFGLDHTVTAGIVSAIGRGGMGLNTFEDFIQTDAAINPGNSGGPMVNLHGELIGINSAIRSASGGNNGVGFAIPANLAMDVARSLIDNGRVERGYLGVGIQPLTPELAASLGHPDTRGALVAEVVPDSPAARAGVQAGDIVTHLDRQPVASSRDLLNTIGRRTPGDVVEVVVDRAGTERTIRLTLGERPGPQAEARGDAATPTPSAGDALGMRVQPLTDQLARRLGVDAGTTGLVVTEVRTGSPAAAAGLRVRDVILDAGRKPVSSAEDLDRAAREATDGLLLRVLRDGRATFIVVGSGS